MHGRPLVLVLLILTVMGICGPLRAQSLADVAKKEEERRKTVTTPTKVYTNKDLSAVPAGAVPPPSASASAQALADGAKAAADGEKAANGDKDKETAKDQAYWSGRRKTIQDKLDRDETFSQALQTRINSLATDVVNRDDPAQRAVLERERVKALADLARLQQDIASGKKALADLEEDARRAGVPAGWLR
jgi:hypothetical protein